MPVRRANDEVTLPSGRSRSSFDPHAAEVGQCRIVRSGTGNCHLPSTLVEAAGQIGDVDREPPCPANHHRER